MNTTYPRLRGLARRRAARVVAVFACAGALAACATHTPGAGSDSPAKASVDTRPAASTGQATSPGTGTGAAPAPVPAKRPAATPAPVAPRASAVSPAPGREADAPGTIPEVELTRELLYQILASEIAAQRGEYARATATYLKIARETRDPRLARRATEFALADRSLEAALPAAELWHELEPDSAIAGQTLETLLLSTGRFSAAEPLLARRLDQARRDGRLPVVYQKLQELLSRVANRAAALELLDRLATPDRDVPAARLALGAVAAAAEMPARALDEAQLAMKLAPDESIPVLAAARYAQQAEQPARARQILREFLDRHPDAGDVRFALARQLMAEGDAPGAREEFEQALARQPDNPVVLFALGQLAYQGGEYRVATRYLERYIALPPEVVRDNAPAFLFLGQIAEDQQRYKDALAWYERIGPGEQFITSRVRQAVVLGEMGDPQVGRKLLHETSARNQSERIRLILGESQVLRNVGSNEAAFDLTGKALQTYPDDPDLLYDQAMVAERLDRLDVLEANLRRIIAAQPDHAHAYNALGYTLADRGLRLDEAHALIEKALALAPGDAHIEDSMGWVLFRQGRHLEAEKYLRQAWTRSPEAEIGVHLGEVLWAQGRHEEAREIWRAASAKEPGNETLRQTLARLKVQL